MCLDEPSAPVQDHHVHAELPVGLHMLYGNRSAAWLALKRFPEAMDDAMECIRLRGDWFKGHFRLAEAFVGLRRFEEALAAFSRAMELCLHDEKAMLALLTRSKQVSFMLQDQSAGYRIEQWTVGRDFAVSSWSPVNAMVFRVAKVLDNFIYMVGCEQSRNCVLVDVCWDVDGILQCVREAGFRITAAIVTHHHFDHVGGIPPKPYDQYRVQVDGVAKLLQRVTDCRALIHFADVPTVLEANPSINPARLVPTHDDFMWTVGPNVELRFIHTPGHTRESQCILVNQNRLLSGDTVFIRGIGRLDMDDADPQAMFESMSKLRTTVPEDAVIYPGHRYGGHYTTMKDELNHNPALKATSYEQFSLAAALGQT